MEALLIFFLWILVKLELPSVSCSVSNVPNVKTWLNVDSCLPFILTLLRTLLGVYYSVTLLKLADFLSRLFPALVVNRR